VSRSFTGLCPREGDIILDGLDKLVDGLAPPPGKRNRYTLANDDIRVFTNMIEAIKDITLAIGIKEAYWHAP
jgi:hypothetical protein